jgi:tetratricopeptide (TPR) repeat protein
MSVCFAVAALALAFQANPDALSESAAQLARQQRFEEAAALWNQALKASPDHFPSLFNMAFMRYSQKRYADAEPLFARAARAGPKNFNTRYLHGVTLVNLGRRDEALTSWRAALTIRPLNAKLMQIMAVEYANGSYFGEACEVARRALQLVPGDPKPYFVAIKVCDDARDRNTFEIAQQAVKKFPASARANFEYAFQLRRAGRREESLPYLKKAIAADPSYEEPYFFHGELLLLEDRFEEAARELRTALKLRPDYIAACVSLGKALMGLERLEEAVAELNACAAKEPKHPQPHLLLSQIYFRLGQEARASAEKELSLKLRRENPALMESAQSRPFRQPE